MVEKPKLLNTTRLLFQLLDVFAGDFPNSAGQRIKFQFLVIDDKLKVFELSKGVPTLQYEQIRNYLIFAIYVQIIILEQSLTVTIKDYIKQQCQIKLPSKSFDAIGVSDVLKVCLLFVRLINFSI